MCANTEQVDFGLIHCNNALRCLACKAELYLAYALIFETNLVTYVHFEPAHLFLNIRLEQNVGHLAAVLELDHEVLRKTGVLSALPLIQSKAVDVEVHLR